MTNAPTTIGLRRAAALVVALNLGYFLVEAASASIAGSVSLFADSVDFLEDASINLLLLVGLAWSPAARARLGMVLAGMILLPAAATLMAAWQRVATGTPPHAAIVSLAGAGALAVNGACALVLAPYRAKGGSLVKAAFLSARNDTLANVAIIVAGAITAATGSLWPDLVTGLAIAALNAGAAWEVFAAARDERKGS